MKNKIRIVIDTNTIVSAVLLQRSISRKAFNIAIFNSDVIISKETLMELIEVLSRPKFEKYIPEIQRLEFLSSFVRVAKTIEITESITECRDKKDNKFLELAVSGNANYIISGDKDLLVLHPFRNINIITSSEFIDIFLQVNSN